MTKEFCDVCGKEIGSYPRPTLTLKVPYEANKEYIDDDEGCYTCDIKFKQRKLVLCEKCSDDAFRAMTCWESGKHVFTKGQYELIERVVKDQEHK